jgi:hypothetical protein
MTGNFVFVQWGGREREGEGRREGERERERERERELRSTALYFFLSTMFHHL